MCPPTHNQQLAPRIQSPAMATCPHCAALQENVAIQLPGDLKRVIRAVKDAVADGTLSVLACEAPTSSRPFEELSPSSWEDHVQYRFACTSCGQRFLLEAETYHGAGGEWRPVREDA